MVYFYLLILFLFFFPVRRPARATKTSSRLRRRKERTAEKSPTVSPWRRTSRNRPPSKTANKNSKRNKRLFIQNLVCRTPKWTTTASSKEPPGSTPSKRSPARSKRPSRPKRNASRPSASRRNSPRTCRGTSTGRITTLSALARTWRSRSWDLPRRLLRMRFVQSKFWNCHYRTLKISGRKSRIISTPAISSSPSGRI